MDPLWFEKHRAEETYYLLNPSAANLTKFLASVFQTSKDLSFHLKVMKAILKPALCMNYFTVEQLLSWYEREISPLGAECLRIYAWLQNLKHIDIVNVILPNNLRIQECFEDASLKYSSDTRYFALSIENLISAYDASIIAVNQSFWLTIILTNLENSHQNVHKLLLDLYKRMVSNYKEGDFGDNKLIERVIELPWTSRNKYPLMAHLISVKPEFLLRSPNFSMTSFLGGLQIALTLHHLLAPSQTLVKVLRGQETFREPLIEMMARVMWHGEEKIAMNLIKFWFSTLKGKEVEKLFGVMNKDNMFSNIPTTSPAFHRLLVIRNTFKKSFKVPDLDERVRQFSCEIDDLATKTEIFHILMESVQAEMDPTQRLDNVLTTLKFIQFNIAIENSSFIDQHVMRKLPDFFNLLASKKMSDLNVLREIFAIIRDGIYQQGFEMNSYESITFSLKLLNIILKQYCGSTGARLSKTTNIEGNLSFGKYLKDNQIWDVTSPIIFNQLLKLMRNNENGDISEMVLRLLVEYFVKKSLVENFSIEGENFGSWINKKVHFELSEASMSASAYRHFILKFEYLLTRSLYDVELQSMIELLKERFVMLKNEEDPVSSMEKGLWIEIFEAISLSYFHLTQVCLCSD